MSLSCECGDWGDSDWYYSSSLQFEPLKKKTSRQCCSCGAKIKPGDDAVEFTRWRGPVTDIEERICGDEVHLASWWMCEACGGLAMAVDELGMCYSLGESMKQQIADYRAEEKVYGARS